MDAWGEGTSPPVRYGRARRSTRRVMDAVEMEFWCPLRLECLAVRRGARRAVVRRTGMGAQKASDFVSQRQANRDLASQNSPCSRRAAVVLGLGGAVDASLRPTDVVVAEEVRSPDGRSSVGMAAACGLAAEGLRSAGFNAIEGCIGAAEGVVTGDDRRRLAAEGLLAVDMESWWLMQAYPPPLIIIRVILDAPRAELRSLAMPVRLLRCLAVLADVAAALGELGSSLREVPEVSAE